MEHILRDIRYGLRMVRSNAGLSLIIILSIGLGIGLNTTIFSMLNLILLQPLPGAEDPGQLVEVYTSYSGGLQFGSVSYPDFKDWRQRNQVFSGLMAQCLTPANLNRNGENEIVSGAIVSGSYFSTLKVKSFLGRTFGPEEDDDAVGSHPVVVLSFGLWKRYFGSDRDIVGKVITVNARNFTVVGVAPERFSGANSGLVIDLWAPLSMQSVFLPGTDRLKVRSVHFLQVVGRLKPEVTMEQASSSLKPLAAALIREFPSSNRGTSMRLVRLGQGPLGLQTFLLPVVTLLMLVVLLILVLACFNVANLLLSRALSRQGEIGVRLAMGASRKDILQLLLTESLVLAVLAGGVALLFAYYTTAFINLLKPPTPVPIFFGLTLDTRVIVFTLALSVLTGLLFGILPALRATKLNLAAKLRNEGSSQTYKKSRLRDSLVVVQIAISLLLLVGAGLIWRSLQFVYRIDPGFSMDRIVLASVDTGLAGYDSAKGLEYYPQLLTRLQTLPGVRAVSVAQNAPMEIGGDQEQGIIIQDNENMDARSFVVDYNIIGPGYFHAMDIPLIQGREFADTDTTKTVGVAIVNEAFAKRFWPGQYPIGKRISNTGREGPYMQIIGVAKDSKYYNILEKPFPYLYLPLYQNYQPGMVLHLQTVADPASYVSLLKHELKSFDWNLPVSRVHTMKQQVELSLLVLRAAAAFMSIFGVLALVLGCIGLYGVMSYSVQKRKPEMAVRLAVGAQRSNIISLILKEGMTLTLIGMTIGLVASLILGHVLSSFLYGVSATDPLTIVAVVLLLGSVALLANFLPAWTATKTSPMETLKS